MKKFGKFVNETFGEPRKGKDGMVNKYQKGDVLYFKDGDKYSSGVVAQIPAYNGDHYMIKSLPTEKHKWVRYLSENRLFEYPFKKGDLVFYRLDPTYQIYKISLIFDSSTSNPYCHIKKINSDSANFIVTDLSDLKPVSPDSNFDKPTEKKKSKFNVGDNVYYIGPGTLKKDVSYKVQKIPSTNPNFDIEITGPDFVGDVLEKNFINEEEYLKTKKYKKNFSIGDFVYYDGIESSKRNIKFVITDMSGNTVWLKRNLTDRLAFETKLNYLISKEQYGEPKGFKPNEIVYYIGNIQQLKNKKYYFEKKMSDEMSIIKPLINSGVSHTVRTSNLVSEKEYNKSIEKNILSKEKIGINSKVLVNSEESDIPIINRIGVVRKINFDALSKPISYLVHFEEDESKNLEAITMYIWPKNIIKVLETSDENSSAELKIGDRVYDIKDENKKIGTIVNIYKSDNEAVVEYKLSNTGKVNYIKDLSVLRKFEIGIISGRKNTSSTEEEEEEDDSNSGVNSLTDLLKDFPSHKQSIKVEDLLEKSYKDFLEEKNIVTKEDLMDKKSDYEDMIKKSDKLKKLFYERTLKQIDLVEQYFDFIKDKISNGKPVYRYTGKMDKNILDLGKKIKVSDNSEGFDRGVVYCWLFKDAAIFKTI